MAELRAGGLAIIIRSRFPENVGKVVKLVACVGEINHPPLSVEFIGRLRLCRSLPGRFFSLNLVFMVWRGPKALCQSTATTSAMKTNTRRSGSMPKSPAERKAIKHKHHICYQQI